MTRSIALGVCLLLVSGSAKAEDQLELGAYGGYFIGGSAEAESDTQTSKATIESSPSFSATIGLPLRALWICRFAAPDALNFLGRSSSVS